MARPPSPAELSYRGEPLRGGWERPSTAFEGDVEL